MIDEQTFQMWWALSGLLIHVVCYAAGGAFSIGIGWVMFLLVCPLAVMLGPVMLIEVFLVWLTYDPAD